MKPEAQNMDVLIARAIQILRQGGLVAFPTETVYGLGADATNATAVRRIFAAKGRPSTNPLIVHVADAQIAKRYVRHWPKAAEKLVERFWPGPLTLVLSKSDAIVAEATAGLPSVGLRAPDHPLALKLLREFDGAIAAPSANRSNRVSPTTADHVRRELGGAVEMILDGGPCQVGIESTVLDLSSDRPVILRPGGVSQAQIEELIGPIDVHSGIEHGPSKSPGRQAVHYAPTAEAWRFSADQVEKIQRWRRENPGAAATFVIIGEESGWRRTMSALPADHVVVMPTDPGDYARRLYSTLHDADVRGATAIFIQMPPDLPEWSAVRDRIMRATRELP